MNAALLALVGNTPLTRITAPLPLPHAGFWAKLEGLQAGGMKARAAVSMLRAARARGELRPGDTVVESTSGTLGIGLAFAGQALGHPVVLVVDAELEPEMRAMLTAYGARLEVVTRPHAVGGWQQARLDRLGNLLRDIPGAYWPDQYGNPDNPAGYAGLARELVAALDGLDVLVCSVGTGGHSSGVVHELRCHWPSLRLIGVDTVNSAIFGRRPGTRLMRGLGSGIHPRNVAYRQFDEVHWIGPAEAADTCRRLAAHAFVTGGWSTGAVARVAAWVARTEAGARVAAVFPDGPHRYAHSIYDDAYCRHHGLFGSTAQHPVEIASPRAAASATWARCGAVTDPLDPAPAVHHGAPA
ncbi:PLP-dependent cysteine synthase family protein [Streptodolium elevatio]